MGVWFHKIDGTVLRNCQINRNQFSISLPKKLQFVRIWPMIDQSDQIDQPILR